MAVPTANKADVRAAINYKVVLVKVILPFIISFICSDLN
jgi:hypothetical protein